MDLGPSIKFILQKQIEEDQVDYFHTLSTVDFFDRFHFSQSTVLGVLGLIAAKIGVQASVFTPLEELLITLRMYATGNLQTTYADFPRLHQQLAYDICRKVTAAIADLAEHFIKLHTSGEEEKELKKKMADSTGFKYATYIIDCFQVKIQKPDSYDAEIYRNKSGDYSINVQVLSDFELLIRDIEATSPGSFANQTVFQNSKLHQLCVNRFLGDCVIMGTSKYTVSRYLLPPILHASTPAGHLYQQAHKTATKGQNFLISSLKYRYLILSTGSILHLDTAKQVIMACAVLENIGKSYAEMVPKAAFQIAHIENDSGKVLETENNQQGDETTRRHAIELFSDAYINYLRELLP